MMPEIEDMVDNHFQATRPGRSFVDIEHQTWDGVYRKYHRGKKRLSRTFLAELRLLCHNNNIPIDINDLREPAEYKPIPKSEVGKDFLPGITLEDYQLKGLHKIHSCEVGMFSLCTGAGKTELIAGICKMMQCPTVIIAEQTIIIDQIKERIELRDVTDEVGLFYAGRMPNDQIIVVGTVQSLITPKRPELPEPGLDIPKNRVNELYNAAIEDEPIEFHKEGRKRSDLGKMEKKYYDKVKKHILLLKAYKTRKKNSTSLKKYLKAAEMLLIDECDLATSKQYTNLFRYHFRGRRRYGFSGTPYDESKPVERLVVQENLGSVIYKVPRKKVEATGRIIPFKYYMFVYGDYKDKKEASMYDVATNDNIVYNEDFHHFVAKLCSVFREDEEDGVLALVERDDLGHSLNDIIDRSDFIHGKTPKKNRPLILQSFEDRETKVLIGGKNVRRGLDLKGGCEFLVNITGGKLSSELNQKIGRSVRKNRRGIAVVADFFFWCNTYLYDHSKLRLKSVVKMGYPCYVVFPDGTMMDGEQFVKSQYKQSRKHLTESPFEHL
jgi:superfamily II DNA or RNA helicase